MKQYAVVLSVSLHDNRLTKVDKAGLPMCHSFIRLYWVISVSIIGQMIPQ